jgi:hypothetical protein
MLGFFVSMPSTGLDVSLTVGGYNSQGKVDMSCETKEDCDLMVVCTQPS